MDKRGCLSTYSGRCVEYLGQVFDKLSISKHDNHDVVIEKLSTHLLELINKRVSLQCLQDNTCGNCEPDVDVYEAATIIIGYLCNLDSDKVKFYGDLSCIFGNIDGSKLLGKSLNYTVSTTGTSSNLSLDLSDSSKDIPQGYSVASVSTKVYGKPKNGRSVILDTDKSVMSATIDYNRYPLTIESKVRYNTPNGTVDMYHNGAIDTPVDNSFTHNFDIQNYNEFEFKNLTSVIETIAKSACDNTAQLNELNNIQLSGCEKIRYNTTKIGQIVGIQASALCDHEGRISKLETTSIKDCTDDCGERTITKTQSEAFILLSQEICDLKKELKTLKKDLEETKNKLSQSQGSSSAGSSSTTSGGGCPNGQCT